jgi:ArsR family transcriptional regulator, arsenate/arsenite/antimonite-responsive transcriptional repressor
MTVDTLSRETGGCCLPTAVPPADLARAERVAEAGKLLSDPIRVQVLDLLRSAEGEVCQCELQPLFSVSQPTMSHHLKKLADAGVVDVERRGRWAYYTINHEALEELKSWLS